MSLSCLLLVIYQLLYVCPAFTTSMGSLAITPMPAMTPALGSMLYETDIAPK